MSKFMKFDDDKVRFELVEPWFHEDLAKALTMGAKKYKANNWKLCKDKDRYIGALDRHFNELKKGNYIDDESLLQHAAHIGFNAMALHYLIRQEMENEDRS